MDLLFDLTGEEGPAVVGAMTTAIVTPPAPRAQLFGVRFLPGEAFGFVGVPSGLARDGVLSLGDVWGPVGRRIADRIGESRGTPARVAAIEEELLMVRRRGPDARVRHAVARILATPAEARVASLARDVGLGERQLERSFVERVGLGPKALARVVRLQSLVARLARGAAPRDRTPWAALASDLGYADQAHLAREVKRLAGVTPTELAAEGPRPAIAVGDVGFVQGDAAAPA